MIFLGSTEPVISHVREISFEEHGMFGNSNLQVSN